MTNVDWLPRGGSHLPAGWGRGGTVGGSRKRPSPLGERLVGAGVISEAELEHEDDMVDHAAPDLSPERGLEG